MGVALPAYEWTLPPEWVRSYVGLPHVPGGRGPDDWDCWGLLMLVLRDAAGVEVPGNEGFHWERADAESRRACAAVAGQEAAARWDPVVPGQERRYDAIILNIAGRPLHVGVVADPGWVLHSTEGAGAAVERYDGMVWRNRVGGFYRFRGAR